MDGLRAAYIEEHSTNDCAMGGEALENQKIGTAAREMAADHHQRALVKREQRIRLAEASLDIRKEAEETREERDRLLGQIREVNERLVVAVVEAQQLADEANAARVSANHNEERFRSLVQSSSAVVWQATSDGLVEVDPDAWRKFTGVVSGPDAWSWLETVHPGDTPLVAMMETAEPRQGDDLCATGLHLRRPVGGRGFGEMQSSW